MENILLRFCRDSNKMDPTKVAAHLGITPKEYQEIERGKRTLTPKQSASLEKLYGIRADYFYASALQLGSLIAKNEIVQLQMGKINKLMKQVSLIRYK